MAEFSTPAPHAGSIRENAFPIKPAIAVALAAAADWLFYGQRTGISAVIFAIALTGGALLANFTRLNKAQVLLAGLLVLAALTRPRRNSMPSHSSSLSWRSGLGSR